MFNLGWMHEYGVGIPQDLHLAKRYYDMSMETSADAVWPVIPCLICLWTRLYFLDLVEAIDKWAVKFNSDYGRKLGFEVPLSDVWSPWAQQNWDVVLTSVLAGMLGAMLMLKLQLRAHRRMMTTRNRR